MAKLTSAVEVLNEINQNTAKTEKTVAELLAEDKRQEANARRERIAADVGDKIHKVVSPVTNYVGGKITSGAQSIFDSITEALKNMIGIAAVSWLLNNSDKVGKFFEGMKDFFISVEKQWGDFYQKFASGEKWQAFKSLFGENSDLGEFIAGLGGLAFLLAPLNLKIKAISLALDAAAAAFDGLKTGFKAVLNKITGVKPPAVKPPTTPPPKLATTRADLTKATKELTPDQKAKLTRGGQVKFDKNGVMIKNNGQALSNADIEKKLKSVGKEVVGTGKPITGPVKSASTPDIPAKPPSALSSAADVSTPKPKGIVGRTSDAIKGLPKILLKFGKILGPLGMAMNTASILSILANDNLSEKEKKVAIGGELGGIAGSALGGAAGAALGTMAFPGIGTFIGALGGAIAGGFLGDDAGEVIAAALTDGEMPPSVAKVINAYNSAMNGRVEDDYDPEAAIFQNDTPQPSKGVVPTLQKVLEDRAAGTDPYTESLKTDKLSEEERRTVILAREIARAMAANASNAVQVNNNNSSTVLSPGKLQTQTNPLN